MVLAIERRTKNESSRPSYRYSRNETETTNRASTKTDHDGDHEDSVEMETFYRTVKTTKLHKEPVLP